MGQHFLDIHIWERDMTYKQGKKVEIKWRKFLMHEKENETEIEIIREAERKMKSFQ